MKTVNDLIQEIKAQPLDLLAFNDKDVNDEWVSQSNREFLVQVDELGAALISLGVKKGDRVAIFASPSSKWLAANLAIMLIGAVAVPIYTTVSEKNFAYIVKSTEVKGLFISTGECENAYLKWKIPLGFIISFDANSKISDSISFGYALAKGRKALLGLPEGVAAQSSESDLASIMYTSGSGDAIKGVCVTFKALFGHVEYVQGILFNSDKEPIRFINIVPLAHIFGFLVNLLVVASRGRLYYSNKPNKLISDCKEIKPTHLLMVPRIIEKIYFSIRNEIKDSLLPKRMFETWAFNWANDQKESKMDFLLTPLFSMFYYSKIRKLFGNHLKLMFIGSSRSDPKVLNFFNRVGVPIIEGYGLTEVCPVTMNTPEHNVIGTVGKSLPGIDVKIDPQGEIILRGDFVMHSYYSDPERTAQAFDQDGWFHTGDMGAFDSEGNLIFISRIDEKCKSSYGLFIDLLKIEEMLNQLSFVNFSVVIGSERPYVTCLIFPNFLELEKMKRQLHLESVSYETIMKMDFVKRMVQKAIMRINEQLDDQEKIREYRFIFDENQEKALTQMLKLRRKYIEVCYKELITEMYIEK